jgi:hypothetical protein
MKLQRTLIHSNNQAQIIPKAEKIVLKYIPAIPRNKRNGSTHEVVFATKKATSTFIT